MKVTIKEQKEKVLEINFPCYVKFSDKYTKVINERTALVVEDWEHSGIGISYTNYGTGATFGLDGWEFISEEQFNEAHLRVSEKLAKYLPQCATT